MSKDHNYFVYIITNYAKTVLYIGVTNDLERRIYEHENSLQKGFAQKYNCKFLLYYEHFIFIEEAIVREKQIKGWKRVKKEVLVSSKNPKWRFLNEEIIGNL